MKKIIMPLILLLPCFVSAQGNNQIQKDSLRNVIARSEGEEKINAYILLTNLYFVEAAGDDLKMDTLLALYREYDAEALRQERYKSLGLIRTNILALYNNRSMFNEVIKLAPEYLDYLAKYEVWQYYYPVYRSYLRAFMGANRFDEAIDGAKQMYEEAKQREHEDGKGLALYMMASVYGDMGRAEEEIKYLKESLEVISDINQLLYLTVGAYYRLCSKLIDVKHYDEAQQQAQEFEKTIYRYEEASKARQNSAWLSLWRVFQTLYIETNEFDKAEIYCNKLDSIGAGPLIKNDVYKTRARIFLHRKQYDKALEMVDKSIELIGDELRIMPESLGLKIMILSKKRGVDDIYTLFQQATNLQDSLRNTELNARLDELRTQYDLDKITVENERNQIEKNRNRNYFLFSLAGCILLSFTLIIWIYKNRVIVQKNRGLFLKIKEQDDLVESLKQMEQHYHSLAQSGGDLTLDIDKQLSGDRQQRKLVARFEEYLLKGKRFADTEINFDDIISALATNRSYFFEAVKTVTDKTPVDYVRTMQLEEARKMLNTTFDLNIELIADECGFNSRATFYRLFRERYQISPAEYRKIAKEKY